MKRALVAVAAVLALHSISGSAQTVTVRGASTFVVLLTWDAPASPTDPVVGYRVFRCIDGTETFGPLNPTVDAATAWTDATVQAGQTYDYLVDSVDAAGALSAPSIPIIVAVPLPPGPPTNLVAN